MLEHREVTRLSADQLDQLAINTIRTLSIDAVQQAKSGHPGTPMAMAPVVYTLWQEFLRFDPDDPIWPNRDRFVLSAGHASTLLYSMLHLTGVKSVNEKYERLGTPTVALDDLSLDLANLFIQQHFVGQLAIQNLLADGRNALGAERIGRTRPAQRRLFLLPALQQYHA